LIIGGWGGLIDIEKLVEDADTISVIETAFAKAVFMKLSWIAAGTLDFFATATLQIASTVFLFEDLMGRSISVDFL
jgi:hypothetical protein